MRHLEHRGVCGSRRHRPRLEIIISDDGGIQLTPGDQTPRDYYSIDLDALTAVVVGESEVFTRRPLASSRIATLDVTTITLVDAPSHVPSYVSYVHAEVSVLEGRSRGTLAKLRRAII